MLYVYALLLSLFVKRLILRMRERRFWVVFIGLGEILSLLPTYLFKGSKFHVVLFKKAFVSFDLFLSLKKILKKGKRSYRH